MSCCAGWRDRRCCGCLCGLGVGWRAVRCAGVALAWFDCAVRRASSCWWCRRSGASAGASEGWACFVRSGRTKRAHLRTSRRSAVRWACFVRSHRAKQAHPHRAATRSDGERERRRRDRRSFSSPRCRTTPRPRQRSALHATNAGSTPRSRNTVCLATPRSTMPIHPRPPRPQNRPQRPSRDDSTTEDGVESSLDGQGASMPRSRARARRRGGRARSPGWPPSARRARRRRPAA
jgi:hypothetical protein